LPAIIDRVLDTYGTVEGYEAEWLDSFLTIRRSVLKDPDDEGTKKAWSESVSRVDALRSMLDGGNMNLLPPLRWRANQTDFELDC
jgi:chitosanase